MEGSIVGGGFECVEILDEALAVEAEIAYARPSGRVAWIRTNEDATNGRQEDLYGFNATGTDIKVLDQCPRFGIDD